MISIRALSNASGYVGYLEKESVGEWLGAGAKELGLAGEIAQNEYRALCRGEHPITQEYLRPIRQAERVDIKRTERLRELEKIGENDEIKYLPRQAFGVVLSSPKTVSIQEMCDVRLLECHDRGVTATVQEMETICGGLVIAAYQHRTSRTHDPLIHTHLVVMNMRLKDDGWKALDAWWLYKNKAVLTEQFERTVLQEAERIGYKVDYPHLAGVSDDVFNKFSKRAGEREDAIKQYKQERDIPEDQNLSERQVAALVYRNRGPKQDAPQEQIRASQLARLSPSERSQLHSLKEKAYEHSHRIHLRVAQGEESSEAHHLTYGERIRL
jgi:conjugative relaxase-like TrwC/TraI family protein